MQRQWLGVVVVAILACPLVGVTVGRASAHFSAMSRSQLGQVLYCMRQKLAPAKREPPKAHPDAYAVQVVYGNVAGGSDEPEECQMLVYGPRRESAVLYRLHPERTAKGVSYEIGDWATFKSEKRRLVPDEFPGGVGTYFHLLKVFRILTRRPLLRIEEREVRAGSYGCEWWRDSTETRR